MENGAINMVGFFNLEEHTVRSLRYQIDVMEWTIDNKRWELLAARHSLSKILGQQLSRRKVMLEVAEKKHDPSLGWVIQEEKACLLRLTTEIALLQ